MQRLLPRRRLTFLAALGLVAFGAILFRQGFARTEEKKSPDAVAVERAREMVHVLDDVYKGFVVQITETYVKAQVTTPAARVAKKVFKHVEGKGWHTARLLDATGEPLNAANAPKTAFEKEAVAKLKSGKDYFEEVATKDGKPVLRAATQVPVVMKQCITCHPGHKEGELIGVLTYEVPIK
jgi:hypothetical protein